LIEFQGLLRQKYQTHMDNRKIILTFYIVSSLIVGFMLRTGIQYFYSISFRIRQIPGITAIREAVPVAIALILFAFLARHKRYNDLLDDVVSELKKVTWPSREDVVRSTVVVLACIAIASLILGFFDVFWGKVVGYLLNRT
jgi:preprotein translocase subunit SecE